VQRHSIIRGAEQLVLELREWMTASGTGIASQQARSINSCPLGARERGGAL